MGVPLPCVGISTNTVIIASAFDDIKAYVVTLDVWRPQAFYQSRTTFPEASCRNNVFLVENIEKTKATFATDIRWRASATS